MTVLISCLVPVATILTTFIGIFATGNRVNSVPFILSKFLLDKTRLIEDGLVHSYMRGQLFVVALSNLLTLFVEETFTTDLTMLYIVNINFLLAIVYGLFTKGLGPIKGQIIAKVPIKGIGKFLIQFLVAIIKFVITFIKPTVTFVRLFINIKVGHLLLGICDQLLGEYSYLGKVPVVVLKSLTISIQTYIFYIFSCDIVQSLIKEKKYN